MQNDDKSPILLSALDYWQQWYELTTRMWLNTLSGSHTSTSEPSDFYHSWTRATHMEQEQATKPIRALFNPHEAWKVWLDTTIDIWREAASTSKDSLGIVAAWLKVMEDTQEQVRSGQTQARDPFTLFNEWYNTISKPWAKMTEDIIASEQFLEFTGPFLESHSNLTSAFRRASEAYFKTLRLPTLSDLAHVARLVVELEEKVDRIDEALERVQLQAASQAPADSMPATTADLEQRLLQIESKLDRTLALLEQWASRPAEPQ